MTHNHQYGSSIHRGNKIVKTRKELVVGSMLENRTRKQKQFVSSDLKTRNIK